MRRLRVAIITPGFPESEADTACTPALADYLLGLQRYAPEVEVRIFALSYPHRVGRYSWHGLPVFAAGRANQGRLGRAISYWQVWRELRRVNAAHGPFDVIHSFWLGPAAVIAQIHARMHKCRHVVTLMGQEIRLSMRYGRLLLDKTVSAISIGEHQRDYIVSRIPQARLNVIPFGIDELPVDPVPADERNWDLAFVGSLISVKQPTMFLDILAQLPPTRRAIMIGDGPLRGAIEARLHELGLADRVTLAGQLSREAALRLLAQARVLLHTSEFEGGPTVLDEALALGVAVAIRPVGKARDGADCIVADGVKDLVSAVEGLLAKPPPSPRIVCHVRQTVEHYLDIYAS